MQTTIYIYDIKKLEEMQKAMSDYQFSSIAYFFHRCNTVEELLEIDAADVDNKVIDLTNLIKDGTYYKIFIERYLWALRENFENIHFSLQSDCLDSFKERFPYFFDEEEINCNFQTSDIQEDSPKQEIEIHQPLDLYTYKNQASIKKLYKDGLAISLSNLMDECESISFRYNLENIRYSIEQKKVIYIDLTSIIKTLTVRRDLTFQFEIFIHHIALMDAIKYTLDNSLLTEAFNLFPLVFGKEQSIDDSTNDSTDEKASQIALDEINRIIYQINEKFQGHIIFKEDFKQAFLKFSFLNKMRERKILSILLCGDSGIGKTEFAKIASDIMFPKEPLIKINFGNYSTEGVLNSLIGSPPGYIGSEEGGELINKTKISKSRIILIDEFEKATPSVFNFFYELLEDGKFTDRHGVEHNLDGYIIIFTSNMKEKQYVKHIPDSLKSRFDMVYNFEDLLVEDKHIYINNTAVKLVEKLKNEFDIEVDMKIITPYLNELIKYKNLRDMKRKIEDIVFSEFFKHYSN